MRIDAVSADARRRSFSIRATEADYVLPYAKLRLEPTVDDPVAEVFVDPELGKEGFTYRLRSGAEETIHLDAVREVAQDPEYLQEILLHDLTLEARRGLEESGLGKRQVARLLGTSPSQLYRLLDPANTSKSVGQMLALLHLVDREVRIEVMDRRPTRI